MVIRVIQGLGFSDSPPKIAIAWEVLSGRLTPDPVQRRVVELWLTSPQPEALWRV